MPWSVAGADQPGGLHEPGLSLLNGRALPVYSNCNVMDNACPEIMHCGKLYGYMEHEQPNGVGMLLLECMHNIYIQIKFTSYLHPDEAIISTVE